MVKPLAFKGDKKPRKRKAPHIDQSSPFTVQDPRAHTTEEDDSWVTAELATDPSGPVIFVLPSTQRGCLACDANGKVFVSDLVNMVDDDPRTAEPHDVRQVWIANRVTGTEKISFKGHHQNYLSCDNLGTLSATREAISPEELFLCIPSPDVPGSFSLQTVREKYLTIVDDSKGAEMRGDAHAVSCKTALGIRMQARFKPRLKANKEQKAQERIGRKELEETVGRRLEDGEVRRLKKARVQGNYREAILDVRVQGKHDKYT